MTDDQTLLDLAGRATPRPWHHVNAFQTVPASNTVHGRVPAERVDYVSTWPDLGTPPGHRVVIQQPDRECRVRSEDMAYITAACNEVPRLISEKRSEAARADLTGFMLAWVVAVAGRGVNWSDLEDDFADAIDDSMDVDWTARDGAKAVVRVLDQIVGGAE